MLSFSGLNWLAIVVAAIAYFGVAAVWYQPKVLGTKWMQASGVEPSNDSPRLAMLVGTLVAYFLMAMLLAMIAGGRHGGWSFADGLVLGLFTGVVFVAAQTWVNAGHEGRPMSLVAINGGIGVVGHVIMAVIVTTWT